MSVAGPNAHHGRYKPKPSATSSASYSEPRETPWIHSNTPDFSAATDLRLKNGARIAQYQVMQGHGREDMAMELLREVGREVRGVMKGRGWFCPLLLEFIGAPGPKSGEKQLLGMNSNRGQKIYLRLRGFSSQDLSQPTDSFLPIEEIISTMLHELAHNVRGPHDAVFQRTLDELHEEYFESKRQRVRNGGRLDGEGFDTPGARLGGWAGGIAADDPLIRHVGRKAAEQAERRRAAQLLMSGGNGGVRLGGPSKSQETVRGEAVAAASRRIKLQGQCPSSAAEQNGAVRWHEEEELRSGIKVITILDDDGGSGDTEKGQSVAPRVAQRSSSRRSGQSGPQPAKVSAEEKDCTIVNRSETIAIDNSSSEEAETDHDGNDDEDFEEVRAVIKKKARVTLSSDEGQTEEQRRRRQQQQQRQQPVLKSRVAAATASTGADGVTSTSMLTRPSIAAKVALESYRAQQRSRRIEERDRRRRQQSQQSRQDSPSGSGHHRPIITNSSTATAAAAATVTAAANLADDPAGWTCQTCTLVNPGATALCDACASPRPGLALNTVGTGSHPLSDVIGRLD